MAQKVHRSARDRLAPGIAGGIGLLLVCIAVAGCGGSSSSSSQSGSGTSGIPAPTRAQFIAEADGICRNARARGIAETAAIRAKTNAVGASDTAATRQALANQLNSSAGVESTFLDQLRALHQPPNDGAVISKYLAGLSAGIGLIRQLATNVANNDTQGIQRTAQQAQQRSTSDMALARSYGFKVCGAGT